MEGSKDLFDWKLLPLNDVFLPNKKYFGHKIGLQLNNTPLVVEQSNYETKNLNAYIVYNLDNWPKNPLRNFTSKNSLVGATNIIRNSDRNIYVYSGYE